MRTTNHVTYTRQEKRALRKQWPSFGLGGPAGAGKDTAADQLADLGYQKFAFADRLREICRFIWPDEPLEENYRAKMTSIGRAIEAAEGVTEAGAFTRALSHVSRANIVDAMTTGPVVVTDTRFPEEFEFLRGEGFIMVRLTVPRDEQIARLTKTGKLKDESYLDSPIEHYLDDYPWDATYENTGTSVDLNEFLVGVIRRHIT